MFYQIYLLGTKGQLSGIDYNSRWL